MSDYIDMDIPDLDGFIRDLDLTKDEVARAIPKAMQQGAKKIVAEQQRLIRDTSKRCAAAIGYSGVFSDKRGKFGVSCGYLSDAFAKKDADGSNPGVIGVMYEHGRPGSSRYRTATKMKQTRHGKQVEVSKGAIAPVPHIRYGFDLKIGEAADTVINTVANELKKVYHDG